MAKKSLEKLVKNLGVALGIGAGIMGFSGKANAQKHCQPFQPDSNTIALFHFDEGRGSMTYDTTGRFTGQILQDGGDNPNSWVNGAFGYAIGYGGHVETRITTCLGLSGQCPPSTEPILPLKSFSIEFYVKQISTKSYGAHFIYDGPISTNWIFGIDTGRLFFVGRDITLTHRNIELSGNTVIDTTDFNHIAMTYNADTKSIKMYLNGMLEAFLNLPERLVSFGASRLSYISDGDPVANRSVIDELRVSNIERDIQEDCRIHFKKKHIKKPKLHKKCEEFLVDQNTVSLWHFNEGADVYTYDATGRFSGEIQRYPTILEPNLWTNAMFSHGIKNEPSTGIFVKSAGSNYTIDELINEVSAGIAMTVEAFIKPETLTPPDTKNNFQTIAINPRQWTFGLDNIGRLYLRTFDSQGLRHSYGGSSMDLNEFNYVAFTYNGSTGNLKFYKDGFLDKEQYINNGAIDVVGAYITSIGVASSSPTPAAFQGVIDEVRISNIEREINSCGKIKKDNLSKLETELTNLEPIYFDDTPLETKLNMAPNPFYNKLGINFSLNKRDNVKIGIYDITGRKVADLVDETKDRGSHSANLNGWNLKSGVYIVNLEIGDYRMNKKVVKID